MPGECILNARLSLIYLAMILLCTLGGFLAGEYVQSAGKSFASHQKQLYFSSFPKFRRFDNRQMLDEVKTYRWQLLSVISSIGGFLLGVSLVLKSDAKSLQARAST